MPGPVWDGDHPEDIALLVRNGLELLRRLRDEAPRRALPDLDDILGWHTALYTECQVPVSGYVGHLRGDVVVPALVGYEVGVGPLLADGLPERVGVPSTQVADEVESLIAAVHSAVTVLDDHLPVGVRPSSVDELDAVVRFTAEVHGEWVRLHPFANGNGRTARVWAAWVAQRYSLPVFVTLKPRPGDVAYARASRESMGRPPDFRGSHDSAAAVFGHLLALSLL